MKKLLSLFAALGLLAFVATPIYAQEEDVVAIDEEPIVAEEEAPIAEEATIDEQSLEQIFAENPEMVNDLNAGLDEILGALEEENAGITDEFNAQFTTDEERAAAALGLAAIFAGFGMIVLVVAFICWLIKTIALWKAFKKAGEAGWKAIIPVYNVYIQYKLAGMKNWFWYCIIIALIIGIIAACIPDYKELITNIGCAITGIILIVMTFQFARKYGWGVFTSILFVLFYPICILILAFGNSKYQGKSETVVEA